MSTLISLATLAVVATPAVATASYGLLHTFDQSNFFQNFSFYSGSDPTDGFVQYLGYEEATAAGLASVESGNVYLGADFTNTYTTEGRPSTRVESNFEFTQGLLIADLAHMPGNACGIWPAFWTVGSDWPYDGEIDIIEGVSNQSVNAMTLHTENQCSITSSDATGTLLTSECSEVGVDGSTGCQFSGTEGSFGTDFNSAGGGVYAMEWTSSGIKVWFFPRSQIPDCITSGNPDPSNFGTPMANFKGSCDFESDFQGQTIVFNTDFCGSWAGEDYASSSCPMTVTDDAVASCEAYVGSNPSAFSEAYWEIVSVKVYQKGISEPSSHSTSSIRAGSTTSASHTSTTSSTSSASSLTTTSPATASTTSTASRITSISQNSGKSPSPSSNVHSSGVPVAGGAGVLAAGLGSSQVVSTQAATTQAATTQDVTTQAVSTPSTTSCSSKSTITITSVITPSSAAVSKSVVPISSSAANPVNAVSASTSSKLTTTTVAVTSYVDVCPSGYVTKTITQTVTYCPAESSTIGVNPAFTTTSKLCATGCGATPTTVVVVIPVETSTTSTTIKILGSGGSSASASGTETLPAIGASTSVATASTSTGSGSTSKVGSGSAVPSISSSVRVPAAVSSGTVPSVSKPSSSVPGSGSVTTKAVSPAYTGAASKTDFSIAGLVAAAMAAYVLFI